LVGYWNIHREICIITVFDPLPDDDPLPVQDGIDVTDWVTLTFVDGNTRDVIFSDEKLKDMLETLAGADSYKITFIQYQSQP